LSAGEKILKGMEEAVRFASGEVPAARIHLNGHSYVPETRAKELEAALRIALPYVEEAYAREKGRATMFKVMPASQHRYKLAVVAMEQAHRDRETISLALRGTEEIGNG
jgi:hypothetical protein